MINQMNKMISKRKRIKRILNRKKIYQKLNNKILKLNNLSKKLNY